MPRMKVGNEFLVAKTNANNRNINGGAVATLALLLPLEVNTFPYDIGTIAANTNIIRMTIPADLRKNGSL